MWCITVRPPRWLVHHDADGEHQARSDSVFTENPRSGNTMKTPTKDTGTVSSGDEGGRASSVGNTNTTMMTAHRSEEVWTISSMPAVMAAVVSSRHLSASCRREALLDVGHRLLDACWTWRAFEPDLVDGDHRRRLPVQAAHRVVEHQPSSSRATSAAATTDPSGFARTMTWPNLPA